jgi:hypothetical protein
MKCPKCLETIDEFPCEFCGYSPEDEASTLLWQMAGLDLWGVGA